MSRLQRWQPVSQADFGISDICLGQPMPMTTPLNSSTKPRRKTINICDGQVSWEPIRLADNFYTLLFWPTQITMLYTMVLGAALAVASTYAVSFADVRSTLSFYSKHVRDALPTFPALEVRKDPECPAVWKDVVKDLSALFIDRSFNPSQCNDDARAAIRVCS